MPESIIKWSWSTKYKGEKCVIRDNNVNGVNSDGSNCFIEPSFGVNDTRTVKLRYCSDNYRDMDNYRDRTTVAMDRAKAKARLSFKAKASFMDRATSF
jgi:hypothetical protein